MRVVNATRGCVVPIGRLGEQDATQVRFDVGDFLRDFGSDGVFQLLHERAGDSTAYPCAVTRDGNAVIWEIGAADAAEAGYGRVELVYVVGGAIAKSEIYTTMIGTALTGGAEPPEPWEDWVAQVLAAGSAATSAAQAAALDAEAASTAAESAASSADSAEDAKEAARTAEENAAGSAETAGRKAADAAGSAEDAAESAQIAAGSAEAASTAAESAASSADSAEDAKEAAQTAEENAAGSAETAGQKAADAAGSAEDAAESAQIAAGSAETASAAAGAAASSAGAAASSAGSAAASAQSAAAAVVHAPTVGTNGHWYVWSQTEGGYVDTGIAAQGEPGEDGDDAPQIDDTQASSEHPWSGAKTAEEIAGRQDKLTYVTVPLSATGWVQSGEKYTKTVSVPEILEAQNIAVFPTPTSLYAYGYAAIICADHADGTLTFSAQAAPEDDLVCYVIIFDGGGAA